MKEIISQYWSYAVWFIFGSGIVCEIVPFIKFNPISLILGWIGKKLNKEVQEEIIQIKKDVKDVKLDLQDHKVESWRREILNFSDSLRLQKNKTKDNFDYVISLHDQYEKYIKERNMINGKTDAAFDYIMKRYNDCLDNNSFYTGK